MWPSFTLVNVVRALLALALVAPLVVTAAPWPETLFPYVVGKALWTRTLIEVAFGLWLWLLLRDPAYRPPRWWLLGLFALYAAIALLAGVFGVSLTRSLWSTYERMGGWVALAHWFAFILMLVSVFRAWSQWRALLNFNVGVGVALGILGLAEQLDWGWFPSFLHPSSARRAATLGNPTYLGGYMAVNVLIAAAFLASSYVRQAPDADAAPPPSAGRRATRRQQRRRQRTSAAAAASGGDDWQIQLWRTFWATAIILGLLMLWWSGTRGAMAGLGGGIIAFGAAYALWGPSRNWRIAGGVIFAGAMAGGIMALLVAGINPASALREGFGAARAGSISERLTVNRVALDAFTERPILGWGPDNFAIAYERLAPPAATAHSTAYFDQSHNKVLEELATSGILGALAYLSIWGYLLSVFIRKLRFLESGRRLFTALAGAGLAAYFAQNLFLFDTPGTLPQLLLLMSFAVFIDSLPLGEEGRRRLIPVPSWPAGMARAVAAAGRGTLAGARAAGLHGLIGAGFVTLGVVVVVFFFNARIFTASQSALNVLRPDSEWNEVFASFEDAVTTFPPLGNEVRVWIAGTVDRRWFTLVEDPTGGPQLTQAINLMEQYSGAGQAMEPENHRLYAGMAVVYQRSARYTPEHLPQGRQAAERAVELAPDWFGARRLLLHQEALENGFPAAEQELERYLDEAPELGPRLYAALGDFYRRQADDQPQHLVRARELAQQAMELDPNLYDARHLLVVLEAVEQGPEAGLQEIERQTAERPDLNDAFFDLRNLLNENIAAQQNAGPPAGGQQ